jgi:hypothetical protein
VLSGPSALKDINGDANFAIGRRVKSRGAGISMGMGDAIPKYCHFDIALEA